MNNNIELGVVPKKFVKKNKIVTDPAVSRRLLKDGFRIVDIKPKRGFPRESIFVFEIVDGLLEKIEQYTAERETYLNTTKEEE